MEVEIKNSNDETIETLQMSAAEVKKYIKLIKLNGYTSQMGRFYDFDYATVVEGNKVWIFLNATSD